MQTHEYKVKLQIWLVISSYKNILFSSLHSWVCTYVRRWTVFILENKLLYSQQRVFLHLGNKKSYSYNSGATLCESLLWLKIFTTWLLIFFNNLVLDIIFVWVWETVIFDFSWVRIVMVTSLHSLSFWYLFMISLHVLMFRENI